MIEYTVIYLKGHFDKDFAKSTRKRGGPTGKHFGVFSPRYSLKLHFEWKI